jgi:hypothetical protein
VVRYIPGHVYESDIPTTNLVIDPENEVQRKADDAYAGTTTLTKQQERRTTSAERNITEAAKLHTRELRVVRPKVIVEKHLHTDIKLCDYS